MAEDVAGSSDTADAPALVASVVVPTHARPERLAHLLETLAAQTLDASRFEVVVVDDGSPAHARPPEPAADSNVRLLRQTQAGPAAARNRGARAARATLLLFVDDDCAVAPGWIEAFVAAHARAPRALLGGSTVNGLPDNPYSSVAESLLGFLDEEARERGGTLDFVASNNIACAHERFFAIGGFDADYPLAAGEDRAFCRTWMEAHGTIERVDDARAWHRHALDLARFWRQQHNYGRGAARFHAEGAAADARVPRPLGFYLRLVLHPLRRRDWPVGRRIVALPLTALSQVAVATGLRAGRRRRAVPPRAVD